MANTSNRGEGRPAGQAREQMEEAKSHLQQAGAHAKEAATTAAAGAAQQAQDAASNVAERARDMASSAADRAGDAISSVGQRMSSVAGSLRQSAPREGALGSAASAVADRLDQGGRYLQEHDLGDMTNDLAGVIRRNPLPSLLVAFGFGFLIGMASRR
jgi:hypothetical protein